MYQTAGQVVRALKAFRDYYQPQSRSVLTASSKTTDVDADPFRRGFLESVDLRSDLLKRLSSLGERERSILIHWYVMDEPVGEICEKLSLSRSHCYRLRDRALDEMLDPESAQELLLQPAFA